MDLRCLKSILSTLPQKNASLTEKFTVFLTTPINAEPEKFRDNEITRVEIDPMQPRLIQTTAVIVYSQPISGDYTNCAVLDGFETQ